MTDPAAHDAVPIALNAVLALAGLGVAAWLRPWRLLRPGDPPWPWLAMWVAMPMLWALDRAGSIVQPMSGAVLLGLFAGWPLAVIATLPVAAITMLAGHVEPAEALHRLVWLGIAPATLGLVIGAALRRWLPHHLFVYILGRAYLGTLAACALAGAAAVTLHPLPGGTGLGDLIVARLLMAFGEAFITGMLVAILVAFRPQWLASYSDRLYLPRD